MLSDTICEAVVSLRGACDRYGDPSYPIKYDKAMIDKVRSLASELDNIRAELDRFPADK